MLLGGFLDVLGWLVWLLGSFEDTCVKLLGGCFGGAMSMAGVCIYTS